MALILRGNGVVEGLTDLPAGSVTTDDIVNNAVTADKLHTTLDLSSKTLLGLSTADLSDYEEGTWTPYWSTTGTSPTVTYTQQQGNYIKIGQFVFCEFSLQGSAYSGGSGNLRINGLPFTTAPNWAGTLVSGYNYNLNQSVVGYNESNSNYVNLTNSSTTNGADYIAYNAVAAPFHMIATITYRTTG
jgi:hypothetical protein